MGNMSTGLKGCVTAASSMQDSFPVDRDQRWKLKMAGTVSLRGEKDSLERRMCRPQHPST